MTRQSQLGVRKNPAPHARQHGLRLAADMASENALVNGISQSLDHPAMNSSMDELKTPVHAAPISAATAEETSNQSHLLTVHEVADLLQVPVSWVYGRMRKRSLERLPGYRLGKYWRFSEAEVLAWLQSQKQNVRAA